MAIYFAVKKSVNTTVNLILWTLWSVMSLLILNEKLELFKLPEIIIFVTAISLALVHGYNLKYCQCNSEKCCTNNG